MFEDDETDLSRAELFADGSRGVYIPQHFAESVKREYVDGVSAEDWETLEAGPDADWYWDTWDRVTNNATINHPTLGKCYLWQEGDLWIVPFAQEESAQ
jgi:hypothetical protein